MRLLVCFSTVLVCAQTLVAVETTVATGLKSEVSIRIDPDQLQRKLNEKNLRVLDVRSRDQYAQGHIPGALRVDVGDWKKLATAASGLRDAKGWTDRVRPLGLTKEPHVVVYGSNLSSTARIWWLLKYVGVKNVSILDGGWEWWMKKERTANGSCAGSFSGSRRAASWQHKGAFGAGQCAAAGRAGRSRRQSS